MASFSILFIFINVSFLMFAKFTQAQDSPFYLFHYCSIFNTTTGSALHTNIRTLLSNLSSNALTSDTGFYNTTIYGENPLESAFGFYMCRGDVPHTLCQQCVQDATQRLSTVCPLARLALIWYDECSVRYANDSIFSFVNTWPAYSMFSTANGPNKERFMPLLFNNLSLTADEAVSPARSNSQKFFATRQANVSGFQSLYCLVQCSPDLPPNDCRTCLSKMMSFLSVSYEGQQGGRLFCPSCNVRYELYPFYRSETGSPPAWIPKSNFPGEDSQSSEDPTYLNYTCSTDLIANSTFQTYLNTLLSYMPLNASDGNGFYKGSVKDTVHGIFMCRGDLPSLVCERCVRNATDVILSHCKSFQEAIIVEK